MGLVKKKNEVINLHKLYWVNNTPSLGILALNTIIDIDSNLLETFHLLLIRKLKNELWRFVTDSFQNATYSFLSKFVYTCV